MSNTRNAGAEHGPDNPAFEAGMSRDVFNIPQNVILDGIRAYSDKDQQDLLWLSGYVRETLHGSRSELCEALKCDWTTIWRVLCGKYGAAIERFMGSVRHLRKQASQPGSGFVETVVTRKIMAACDLARDQNAIVHICGPSGRGKSHTLREWRRRNNHGLSHYLDVPVLGGIRPFLEELSHCTGVNAGRSTVNLCTRLEKSFDWRNVLIIDEAVRLLPTGGSRNVRALEWIRRLHDVSGVGIVLVSTDIFRQEMERGAISDYLEQLLGRIEDPLYIPEKVGLQETGDICRAFSSGEADPDLVRLAHKIANARGRLRLLFRLLRQAAALAQHKGQPLGVDHLQAAKALREGLHRWEEE